MENLELAQLIANKIDSKTQEEIENMMDVVCDLHNIDRGWMFRVVGNLYGKIRKVENIKVCDQYSEPDAR